MADVNLDLGPDALLLVTGGTGLVGSHVIEKALARGCRIRALVRAGSETSFLQTLPVELATGSLTEPETLPAAVEGVTHVVHCAAKVGDWGPVEDYRLANVTGLRALLEALLQTHTLRQFVQISSLGVYPAQDHYGTDETAPTNDAGIDGYTLTKVEAEHVIRQYVEFRNLKAVILRPGWIYGARDRTVLPKLIEKLRARKVVYLGSGEQMLNQIYVDNLVDAIFLALGRTDLNGETFNLTDGKLVSRIEFMETICEFGQLPKPVKHVPLPVAKGLAAAMEAAYRVLGKKEAPLLSQARIKFLGLNLDYSIDKARRVLGYEPQVAFRDGMRETMNSIAGLS